MLKIASFTFNPFSENIYIIYDNDSREAIIIDAGCYNSKECKLLETYVDTHNLKPVMSLATHGHIDHICGAYFTIKTWNIPFAIHSLDIPLLNSAVSYAQGMGFEVNNVPDVSLELFDNQEITLGNEVLKIIHTPGHTLGGISMLVSAQNQLFTGDTLFKESIGRTDLPGGDYSALMDSIINKLLPLSADIQVFPGHGPHTTLAHEATYNPFIVEVVGGQVNYK